MNQLKRIAGAGFALPAMLCAVILCVAACSNPSGGIPPGSNPPLRLTYREMAQVTPTADSTVPIT
ncbi:MAG: hypothetical protein LBP23_04695, partial [Treponema sp.]|nr:hypothetical protein [Treponema sp.]